MYLIPEPKRIERGTKEEGFTIAYAGEILLDARCGYADLTAAKALQEEIADTLGFAWQIGKGERRPGCIFLKNSGGNPEGKPASLCGAQERAEAYELAVRPDGIEICGASSAGLWYGVQTLRQLIRLEKAVLPAVRIEDEPEIANRGFFHDVTRGRIPTMQELKHMVDHLSFYKINQLQLYVEHSFLFREFSEVWRDDTPLTAEDILELDRYCAERHVELVPSLASFGHLYKVLRTKTHADLCELPGSDQEPFSFIGRMAHHTLDVTNRRSLELVSRMMEEFLPLFSSRYFNLCADETFDLGTGRSREEGERVGKQRLYTDFLKQLCDLVIEKGRIPMFWGDIICKFPEAVSELPEGTICLNWGYWREQTDEDTRKLAEAGAVQYVCPGVQGWNCLVNSTKDAFENIKRMCTYACHYGAVGVLNTDWGDYGHINHPEFSSVGMIYGAAFSWNPQIPEREEINEAISRLEYGDRSGSFAGLASELNECGLYSWFYMVVYKEKTEDSFRSDSDWYSLDRIAWEQIPEAEEKLFRLEQELYALLPELEERGRKKVYAYLLAAEGTHLFNRIGQVVRRRMLQDKEGIATLNLHPDFGLAEDLEHWYRRYRALWRTVSRESELYRIGEVIRWYGDFLRER